MIDERSIVASMAAIEILEFDLPSSYREDWERHVNGPFWLIRVEKQGPMERWRGIVSTGDNHTRLSLDHETKCHAVYINGPGKVEAARQFIKRYGGRAWFDGELLPYGEEEDEDGRTDKVQDGD